MLDYELVDHKVETVTQVHKAQRMRDGSPKRTSIADLYTAAFAACTLENKEQASCGSAQSDITTSSVRLLVFV